MRDEIVKMSSSELGKSTKQTHYSSSLFAKQERKTRRIMLILDDGKQPWQSLLHILQGMMYTELSKRVSGEFSLWTSATLQPLFRYKFNEICANFSHRQQALEKQAWLEAKLPFYVPLIRSSRLHKTPPKKGTHWNSTIRWHGYRVNKLWLLLLMLLTRKRGEGTHKRAFSVRDGNFNFKIKSSFGNFKPLKRCWSPEAVLKLWSGAWAMKQGQARSLQID